MPNTEPASSLLSTDFYRRLERLQLISRKIKAGQMKGDRLSKRKGRGSEFADYRPYTVGDDLRFLDWNLFGRNEQLFIRLFLEEEDLNVYLLIDNSQSMEVGSPSKLNYAKQIAAALGFVGLQNMDRVTIETIGGQQVQRSPVYRNRRNLLRMSRFLDSIQPASADDLNHSLRTFGLRTSGRGIVVILSDFMDKGGYEEGLRMLIARNLDIYAIQILAQEEINPPYKGDLKLIDIEDGDQAEITISAPLLARYEKLLNAFRQSINGFCTRRGISYLFTSNQVPFEKLVLGYLRSRGLLR